MRSLSAFIGAIYTPMALSLIYNFTVLALIVRSLKSRGTTALADKRSSSRQLLRVILFISCLLGLTWSFAVPVILSDDIAFQYIFALFNTLQGFFVFIFHIARSEDVQKSWSTSMRSIISYHIMSRNKGGSISGNTSSLPSQSVEMSFSTNFANRNAVGQEL